jgi:cyclic pyranopterin phosphate synthase
VKELPALSHMGARGDARMVDVADKPITERVAVATARIRIGRQLRALIASEKVPKGDVLGVARIAGIMAAKRTPDLIPMCHPLALDGVIVDVTLEKRTVEVRATVKVTGKTGAEMEALVAASVAALAFYDMCKSVDRTMVVERIRLEAKRGGTSGAYVRRGRS